MRLLPIYGGLDAGVRPAAREQVHDAVGVLPPSEIARQIGRTLDDITARCTPVACARGCGWCCHQRVDVTAPEIFALAAHVRGRAELLPRVRETAAALRGLSSREHHERRVRCALLDDDLSCSAHAARPHGCRRGHSTDVARCREAYDAPHTRVIIPAEPSRSWNTAALILGYYEGYAHAGRPLDTYELNAALAIALEDETCEARWVAGEDVLAAARTHDAEEIARLLG